MICYRCNQPYENGACGCDDGITLILGDCRDVLGELPSGAVDLVLTDPPYGIKRDGQPETFTKLPKHKRRFYESFGWDEQPPDGPVFTEIFRVSRDQIIWGANYFTEHLPPSMGWLVWDKGQRLSMSDGELAFTSAQRALRSITLNRVELIIDGAQHPTQKPLKLMRWCLSLFPNAQTILDPFAGSGTTGRAAKDLGRRCLMIELEERYVEIAARRLEQQVLPLEMAS